MKLLLITLLKISVTPASKSWNVAIYSSRTSWIATPNG